MNLFSHVRRQVIGCLQELQSAGALPGPLDFKAITVELPRDAAHGDMATNAAMVLASQAQKKPREIADMLAEKLKALADVSAAEVAGPGFINLRLHANFWRSIIPVIIAEGRSFGNSEMGRGQRVNVEYVSANPTGPLHVGHARGAVYGDALALLLLKVGYEVTKEYYINDAGAQVDVLAKSGYLRYREACGETIGAIPQGLYPGEYLIPVGMALKHTHGTKLLDMSEAEWLPIAKRAAIDSMMALIRSDLKDLGIEHDVFTSEQGLHDGKKIEAAIAVLEEKGLLYRGVLEPPKGKKPDDWEEREQLLFKASEFGDDVDRPLQKSNGAYTYFAADLALAEDKIRRGFGTLVYIFGADHGGYKKRMEAAIGALSNRSVEVDIKLCQLVHLFKNGEPLKMSKRAGNFETVRDVLDTVGKDILRFIMLTRKNDMVMDFDLDKVKEQSKDNPVFYVQYAHARARSVLRSAALEAPEASKLAEQPESVLGKLSSESEMALIKRMAEWPKVVESAAMAHEPHRIAFYLHELAAAFHSLWNEGNHEAALRFIVKEDELVTAARLALARAVSLVIASGLNVLGVEPAEEMR